MQNDNKLELQCKDCKEVFGGYTCKDCDGNMAVLEPTLSSVPEEEQRSGELRKQIQDIMTSMPEGVVSTRDIKLQYSTTDYIWVVNGLESLINQQIKSVLDEALANSVFKHKHEAEEHVVDYKNGYNDGVEAAEDVIKEIRSRHE